jgi:hypothetical protein
MKGTCSMTLRRAALLTAGPLAALGLSTGLAHADTATDLFSGDGISITAPDGLTGPAVEVGGLPPIDSEYEYAGQTLDINGVQYPDAGNVYTDTDIFGGNDTLVDLTPGASIPNSDIFDTYSLLGGAVELEHVDVAAPLDGLTTGSYDALVLDGTAIPLPEALTNALGPDFGLTALDVAVLSDQVSSIAAALDVTPFADILTSLF